MEGRTVVNVRVEDGPNHPSLHRASPAGDLLPGPLLGFDGELHSFEIGQRAASRLPEELQGPTFRIPAHLLESLDRDEPPAASLSAR
jgi:hypothetical protein